MFENFGGGAEPTESQHAAPASHLPASQETDQGRSVQLAQATPAGEPIGEVEELLGEVVLTHADGSTSAAAPGTPVYLNDVVTTPVGGAVEIRFVDGTRFSLGQDGEMTLDELVYNPGGGGNELDLSVAQGAFTFVTGAIAGAPGEGMEVRVPVGTIGIRGTAVGGGPAFATADPTDYTIVLLPEPGGRVGRIVLTDLNGRSVILDDALEGMDISSLGLAPGEPVQLTREQVIALLGQSIENIEDILNEVENFEVEDSPEDDVVPEGGPQQEGQLFNTVPNQGGVRTFAGQTLSLGELTSLFTIGDQQGFGDRSGGPLGGFDPDGGLGNDGNDGGPDDGTQGSDGPTGSDDPIIDDGEEPTGFILLTGGDGDDLLDASGFAGSTNITGNGGSDTLTGSAFDDILNGGDGNDLLDAGAGNDQVNGGGGDDLLVGGSGQGNDALDGGAGNDTVVYSSATQSITVNLDTGVAFGDPAIGNDTLDNIENVVGGQGSDNIIGNGEDNILVGGEGGDTLTGGGGDDVLIGGAGNDTAVFTGDREDYTIEGAEGGFYITDNREGAENDGIDFVADDVEVLSFADGDVSVVPEAVSDSHVISEAQQSVENGAAIKTTVNVAAGAVLSFQWNFLDSEPDGTEGTYRDFAVLVIDGQVIELANVADADTDLGTLAVQFDEETGYATYTFEFSTGGEHTIGFAVLNEGDDLFDAGLLLDSVQIVDAFEDGFESGIDPEIWQTIGDVETVGALDGISPPVDEQQALLTSNGASASAIEQFLELPPGTLSETGNQPVAIGNVLDNDNTGGVDADIISLSYDGDPEDVEATAVGSIVTYAATDGSWKMEFDLSTGDYTFTVLETLEHSGSGSLSFPFTYTLQGITGATSSAPLTVVITDGVPNAVDDTATAIEGGDPIGGNVLYNDGYSPDGAWVSSVIIGGETYNLIAGEPIGTETPLGGWLTIDANGEWSYTPPGDGAGSESFTYTVTDGDGDTSSAVLAIDVEQGSGGGNEPPIELTDIDGDANVISVDADNGAAVQITARASDPDAGDSLTYSLTDANGLFEIDSATGVVTLIEGGTLFDFVGSELSITVRATDEGGLFTEENFTIVVANSNQEPDAVDDSSPDFVTDNQTDFAVHSDVLLANDSDPDANTNLTITNVGAAVNGTVAFGIEGLIIFTPDDNYIGPASFEYTVSDGAGGTDTATVHLIVTSPNTPTEGDDILIGTDDGDEIDALGGNDQVTGLSGNDTLIGGEGHDTLLGNDGDDEIYGGGGDDILVSGQGYDFIDGGDGSDFVSYAGAEGGVEVDLDDGKAWKPNFEDDNLLNIENVIGSSHADTIVGDGGVNFLYGGSGDDSLSGGGLDDLLHGGEGDDTINGGGDIDTVLYTDDVGDGVTVNLATGVATDEHGDTDALSFIENVVGTEFGDDITGDDNDNTISGRGGGDFIEAGGGDDTIIVFNEEEFGLETHFDGGDGNDTLSIAGDGVDFSLTDNGQYLNFENVDISTGDNIFTLSAEDVLGSFNGSVTIFGDDDTVAFSDGGWTKTDEVDFGSTSFDVYTNANTDVQAFVQSSITVSNAGG